MNARVLFLLFPACLSAADLPPDRGQELPAGAARAVVIEAGFAAREIKATLPEGHRLEVAAAAPLVTHPIMGCVDDRWRLFIGDAVGVNWNQAQLESNPPNRILLLEDSNADGIYDRSTVFADKMTFPQGACWHEGSLYVASPPGLWKLTDTTGDGVADQREMIVGGFDYTGNAADVHGPKLHPNGRLYWCHGRKGHRVLQKDGSLVHEGKASGIWSCKPDGSDVQWHALGCADNPTGLDFTPEGDLIGTCNLYYSNPRGDTLMHWLYGGVYERADQLQVIADLPRTLEKMPIVHNFGHVAVSGCAFWRSQPGSPLMVTHFNTQRLVRMDLARQGASYRATESEFLKIHDSDVHLTDVIEDRDGSLLVLDTGGWFRIGCPSGLMAKPDVLGAVYRVRPAQPGQAAVTRAAAPTAPTVKSVLAGLKSTDPHSRRRALEGIARDLSRAETSTADRAKLGSAVRGLMAEPLDPPLEHALLLAAQSLNAQAVSLDALRVEKHPIALRRLLVSFVPDDAAAHNEHMRLAIRHLDAVDVELARTALAIAVQHPDADAWVAPELQTWLGKPLIPARLRAIEGFATAQLAGAETRKLLAGLLAAPEAESRRVALRVLAAQPSVEAHEAWLPPLTALLAEPGDVGLTAVLDAVKRLKSHPFDATLQVLADDASRALPLRLKALDAMKGLKFSADTLAMLQGVVADAAASPAARIQAAAMLAAAPLQHGQQAALAPLFATAGPVELEKLLPLVRKAHEPAARAYAEALARNPAIASQQESSYRTLFSGHPPEVFETIVLPAYVRVGEVTEAKKRQLPELAARAAAQGRQAEGKKVFEQGKGTCLACHQIGGVGRALGPDLSKIGAIRTERDLIESIVFPSASLARDYETHHLEMTDGRSVMGVIKSHTAEGLRVMDVAGQEQDLPHAAISASTQLPTSLMPLGLDQTLPEQELLDLVAWLRSLR
jgi:putative membrane-bound dehydrogenase-like protein